ncbi:MAG: 16S rRNA (cytosine(1402)-N(4))-methyltransferase RsmH [Bacteriovoracaceae bacterium]
MGEDSLTLKSFVHKTVLLNEGVDSATFEKDPEGEHLFIDFTFGGGGHSFLILEKFPNSKLIGFDQDLDAIENSKKLAKEFGVEGRLEVVHSNFENFRSVFESRGIEKIDGAILDAGVSSHQFDTVERGFSFRYEADLDMRMDQNSGGKTAKDIVNNYSSIELEAIFFKYGEERYSKRIADAIVSERSKKELETTKDLENIIFHCYPRNSRHGGIHPATRCFQALRIEVNDELSVLETVVMGVPDFLSNRSSFAVISFHSLEDRIVKQGFKSVVKDHHEFSTLTKKPMLPGEEEIKANKRSRSAKMRVLQRGFENDKKKKKSWKIKSEGERS